MTKLLAACALLLLFSGCGKKADETGEVDIRVEQCAVNLGHIYSAKNKWAEEHHAGTTDAPTADDLDPYFRGGMPRCPLGGTYTIGTIAEPPQCSIAAHNSYFLTNMPPAPAVKP